MPTFTSKSLLTVLAGAASVAAHGHVSNIVINGDLYQGYDSSFNYMANPPVVAAWKANNQDNGFVAPDAFSSPDIICHKDATNAKGHAVVKAGDKISIQWETWPESHHGPVIDYLANCGTAGCETVDKTALEFFKIDEVGLIDGSAAPGKWGSDQLIANNNSWLVEIPANIAPGFYVLRHEIIALHSAGQPNGAQNYPQCFNLQVTGSGTEKPAGVKGTALYTPNDKGISFNIYQPMTSYPIPGPALIKDAVSVAQAHSAVTATATALTGLAAAPAATGAPATTSAAAAPAVTTTKAAAVPTTTLVPSATKAVTTAAPQATKPAKGSCQKRRAARRAAALARRHARDVAFLD
ncbi:glycosyl hydrolase family 61-domain-containing protein [Neurospora tetraspora]|uniref:lytic cellulose monooxygenase (C4-dehydrogenating) n=1 Tax=Neurospora tetraspora TaxID=94610 RepID=A0AAE0JDN3_9PEZI|nr:glycosyl hydrolase family 61-domain-containing protein [Neurospora tetraspora]